MLVDSIPEFDPEFEPKSESNLRQELESKPAFKQNLDIYIPGLFQSKYGINPWDDDWDDGM